MRVNTFRLLSSLLLVSSASAGEANVYLSNRGNSRQIDSTPLSSSASTARLLFAQRLDIDQYHTLKDADFSTIDFLNTFGARSHKLFGGDESHGRLKALLIIEGLEEPQEIAPSIQTGAISEFRLQDPPTPSANARLLRDITAQVKSDETFKYTDSFYDEALAILQKTRAGEKSTEGLKMSVSNGRILAHSTSLEQTSRQYGSSAAEYNSLVTTIRDAVAALFEKSISEDWEVIVVAMPRKQWGSIFKRTSTSSWGGYSLPKRQGSGRPDFLPNDFAGTETNVEHPPANDIDFDEFLDPNEPQQSDDFTVPQFPDVVSRPGSQTALPQPGSTSHSFSEKLEDLLEEIVEEIIDELSPSQSNPLIALQQNDTSAPLGILPTCYSTYNACVETTHNCSGHGSCFKKFTDQKSDNSRACFVCGCQNTYRRDSRGRVVKTIQWAGPACQKKDVSMPFWLLGGVTILLVSIIGWGIGLLYSMGSEDLPSVIGAGVAGPRATK